MYGIETRKSYTVRVLGVCMCQTDPLRSLTLVDVPNGIKAKLQRHLQVMLPENRPSTYMKAFCFCVTVQQTVSSCYI